MGLVTPTGKFEPEDLADDSIAAKANLASDIAAGKASFKAGF